MRPTRLVTLIPLVALLLLADLPAFAQDPGRGPAPPAGAARPNNRARARRPRVRRPPGTIVGWPMPPALIIRQRPETHDEIDNFLRLLRGY